MAMRDGGYRDESMALLRDSLRTMEESQDMGEETLHKLGYQRQQLSDSKARVSDMQVFAAETRKRILAMSRKELKHKCMLVCMIIVLLIANGLVLWYRFIKPYLRKYKNEHGD